MRMTDNDPRMLITAIKCQKCGLELAQRFTVNGDRVVHLPYETTITEARSWVADKITSHCKGDILIATEPVPTSHLVGGHEFLHTIGYGHLGEYDPATGEVVP